MGFFELFLLSVGLSMDAFAVAICAGLTMAKTNARKALIVGLYFGGFQAGMPLIGYIIATQFADKIIAYDHWVAFGLLCFLGGKMIIESLKKDESQDAAYPDEQSLKPAKMLPLALATSIDALAVGVSFAFLQVKIVPAVIFIGLITFVISMAGVKIGNVFGTKFKSQAQFTGGIILVLIGLKILLEHIGIINF
jgi:putative Mn2+ efflux pump MntP